jgi:hypothetical protein
MVLLPWNQGILLYRYDYPILEPCFAPEQDILVLILTVIAGPGQLRVLSFPFSTKAHNFHETYLPIHTLNGNKHHKSFSINSINQNNAASTFNQPDPTTMG